MRLLTELLPASKATPGRRRQYLRNRIHGIDKDAFALELARLALTLTDLPNPDGWDLKPDDMFLTDDIEVQCKASTIVLANPPFENFSDTELQHYAAKNASPLINNKAVEMLRRTLASMQPGSVFGFVMPQSMLHGRFARDVRKLMLDEFELREISLFADNVFSFADVESTVLIGRRTTRSTASKSKVRFRRIREWEMDRFRSTYESTAPKQVQQTRFVESNDWDMRIPDLEEVWSELSDCQVVSEKCDIGLGLFYHSKHLPSDAKTYSTKKFEGAIQGFYRIEPADIAITNQPTLYWMNLQKEALQRTRAGTTTGVPQVLMNYARVSRGPWRLKALMDWVGRPLSSNFLVARSKELSLEVLWAIFNSPLANAYAFCHLGKRHNIVSRIREIPIPEGTEFAEIENAVKAYFEAVESDATAGAIQSRLADVDAAVLRQYNLPIDLEYRLLSLFDGWERLGVPFNQSVLLPQVLGGKVRFSDFVHYEKDWRKTNRRRGKLIDKEIEDTINSDERTELEGLQAYAEYYLDRETPIPATELEKLEELLLNIATKKGDDN